MRRPRLLAALLAAATLLSATPALASPAADPSATFVGMIGDCFAWGHTDGLPGTSLIVEHRRADGTLVKKQRLEIFEVGFWEWGCPGPALAPGDRIRFRLPGQSTPFRVFTVPRIQLTPDRAADEVRGKVPGAPTTARLEMFTCEPAGLSCRIDRSMDLDLPTDRTFTVPVDPLTGSQTFSLGWEREGDSIQLIRHAGRIDVQPGSARVIGLGGTPGTKVTVTLRRGTKIVRATATVDPHGGSVTTFRSNGKLVKVKVGDRIGSTVDTAAKLTVPLWNAYASETAISGRCFPGGVVQVRHYDADRTFLSTHLLTADGEFGSWGTPDTVAVGDKIDWWCADADGDLLVGRFRADW